MYSEYIIDGTTSVCNLVDLVNFKVSVSVSQISECKHKLVCVGKWVDGGLCACSCAFMKISLMGICVHTQACMCVCIHIQNFSLNSLCNGDQIEEKRLEELRKREEERRAEEREMQRVQEQQLRMQEEYEEERRKIRQKEEEVRRATLNDKYIYSCKKPCVK